MDKRQIGTLGRVLISLTATGAMMLGAAGSAMAHRHFAENGQAGDGQVLANGQNHPKFLPNGDGTWSSCVSYGPLTGSTIGNAWFGLETAHHGPDSGDPGKQDGCYMADGSPGAGQDDRNPGIR